ncbi:MAG: hypothetical protein IJY61_04310 [Candidatus Gastranaerophilales bacterium]|nr:hypothetical protein [Candidatus Gastranaerophilales bacterium]
MSKFNNVYIQCLESSRDALMLNIGLVCQNLDAALPFTIDKAELCKMYLSLDEHLKDINKKIDETLCDEDDIEESTNA